MPVARKEEPDDADNEGLREDSSDPEYATAHRCERKRGCPRLDAETDVPWSAEKIERFAPLQMAALDVTDPLEWEEGVVQAPGLSTDSRNQ